MSNYYNNEYGPTGYDQNFAASGGWGKKGCCGHGHGCKGCGCGGGGLFGLFGSNGNDLYTIGALGVLAGIAIYLATQLTAGKKRKRRGKVFLF